MASLQLAARRTTKNMDDPLTALSSLSAPNPLCAHPSVATVNLTIRQGKGFDLRQLVGYLTPRLKVACACSPVRSRTKKMGRAALQKVQGDHLSAEPGK